MLKIFSKNKFSNFSYFYELLGWKIFLGILLSIFVGLFDGLGLALFIPLIQLSAGDNVDQNAQLDQYSQFLIKNLNFELTLTNIFILILCLFTLKGIFKFVDLYFRIWCQQVFMRKIRDRNIDLLTNFNYLKFIQFDTGRIQNVMGSETNRVSQAYSKYFKTFHYLTLVAVYISLALWSSFWFSMIVILGGVLINLIFSSLYKRTKYYSGKYSRESNTFQGLLLQKINNYQYLKSTGSAILFGSKLKDRIRTIEKYQLKLGFFEAILGAVREPFTIIIVFAAIFLFIQIFSNPLSSILLSLLLLYRSITFYMGMQEQWNAFLTVSGSLENVQSFSKELKENPEKSGTIDFNSLNNSLKLSNISFSYDSENVIENLSLEINKNETVALVGESGSGKTTLMNILAGTIYLDQGSYTIDDIPFRDLQLSDFRKKTGYIVQDPVVFNDTIFNNISFWDEDSPSNRAKMKRVSQEAALWPFIESLENGENTILGFNGLNISGGQRQRLSIARELYKNAEILFMDEATSNLDSETEFEVQTNINKLKGRYTIVIIAHRLSTVKNADRIIVLKNGTVNSVGNYEELLQNSEEFRRMVELQEL